MRIGDGTAELRLDAHDQGPEVAAWTKFNEQEQEKILRLLQYLRSAAFTERTLAAIRRGLSMDWTSVYFAVGAAAAVGWIDRERVGHYVIVGLTKSGLLAIARHQTQARTPYLDEATTR